MSFVRVYAPIISIFVAICSIIKTQKDSIVTMASISFVISFQRVYSSCFFFSSILLLVKSIERFVFLFDFNTSSEQ